MISSRNNPEIIEVAKLKQKKNRDSTGKYLIEGLKLVNEAINSNANIDKIYLTSKLENKINIPKEIEVIDVSEKVLDKISSQKNPEGIIAVIKKEGKVFKNSKKVLLLDKIQDPGNLGTIIRTADAAGFDSVFCSTNCADLYNEKTIRASMGSIFHITILVNQDLQKILEKLNKEAYETIAAVLNGEDIYINEVEIPKKLALLVGNESHGIDPNLIKCCNKKVALPMIGQAESLNVAIAAGIFMYSFIPKPDKKHS